MQGETLSGQIRFRWGFTISFFYYDVVTAGKIQYVESLCAWHLFRIIVDTNLTLNTSIKMVENVEPFSQFKLNFSFSWSHIFSGERVIVGAVGL